MRETNLGERAIDVFGFLGHYGGRDVTVYRC